MTLTAGEYVEMLRLWEQCCSDVGEGWRAATERLSELEKKAGVAFDMNYTDFEGFHVAALRALSQVEEVA